MILRVASIVEGYGEKEAIPILIRRIAGNIAPSLTVDLLHPIRIPKSKLVKPNELIRAVDLATRRLITPGAILITLDSDDDCPAELGPRLAREAEQSATHIPVALVLAKREFESWFIAASESLRGHRGLPEDLTTPHDPEEIRDAKGWINERMGDQKYVPTLDQPALAAAMDLNAAMSRAPSFRKFYRSVEQLISAVK